MTRQEILEQIWGKDVYVDADNSINTAVRKIRQALHDNTQEPRFVVTIPARGYRFVASVEKPAALPAEVAEGRTNGAGAEARAVATPVLNSTRRWKTTAVIGPVVAIMTIEEWLSCCTSIERLR